MNKYCPYMLNQMKKCLGEECAAYRWRAPYEDNWVKQDLTTEEEALELKAKWEAERPYADITVKLYKKIESREGLSVLTGPYEEVTSESDEWYWTVRLHDREPYCGMVPNNED